jgi:hypothetical protein
MHYALSLPRRQPAFQPPFDLCLGGSPRRDGWEEEKACIHSLAEAGMTWWCEYVPPDEPDYMRKCIERGPLRIDWLPI